MDATGAQMKFVGCDVDEIVRSHAVVMAAEESRNTGQVIQWGPWWEKKRRSRAAPDMEASAYAL